MPRPPRADEAGGLYHALNRGTLRAMIFHKEQDLEAFERILAGALEIHQVELFSFKLMPNHYHLVLRPLVDGEMSRFMAWIGGTHTMRYHAHYHTSGMGMFTNSVIRASRFRTTAIFSSFADTLSGTLCGPGLLSARSSGAGDRFGDGFRSPNLESTMRPRGRKRVRFQGHPTF